MSCVFGSSELKYCRGEGWVVSVNLADYPKVNADRGLGAPATSDIGGEAPSAFFSLSFGACPSCTTSSGPLVVIFLSSQESSFLQFPESSTTFISVGCGNFLEL